MKISLFVLTECTNVTDTQTKTPHDGIGRACIASRGNRSTWLKLYRPRQSRQIPIAGVIVA